MGPGSWVRIKIGGRSSRSIKRLRNEASLPGPELRNGKTGENLLHHHLAGYGFGLGFVGHADAVAQHLLAYGFHILGVT